MSDNTNPGEPNLSIYGHDDAMDDFPVLKAFQQYIDAEQEKSRKRLVTLSIIFAVLMVIVVGVFMLRLSEMSRRNQEVSDRLAERNQQLNDRLVEFAMKERPAQSAAGGDAQSIKALTEALATMQKQMLEQNAAVQKTMREAGSAKPSPEQTEMAKRNRNDQEKIRRATELLKAEKQRLEAEKERLRQEQIDLQRRRLYPEYYAKKDAEGAAATVPAPSPKPAAKSPTAAPAASAEDPDDDAINYFDDAETTDEGDYSVPVDVNGKSAKWRIPVE